MPPPTTSELIHRSWQRCNQRGQDSRHYPAAAPVDRHKLSRLMEQNDRLVSYAQPLIEHLHQSLARTSSLIVLADGEATILRVIGAQGLMARSITIHLVPGADWREEARGTNALALALIENQAVAVVAEEHYYACQRFLRGVACPIPQPASPGGNIGVLGILGDGDLSIPLGRALIQNAVDLIETRLVKTHPEGCREAGIAHSQEALETPLEGLLMLDRGQKIIAANRRARQFIGMGHGLPLGEALGLSVTEKQLLGKTTESITLEPPPGREEGLWLRLGPALHSPDAEPGHGSNGHPVDGAPLLALDSGDSRMRVTINRAMKVVDRNIPLVIQGETGTGKEVFARACHLSSRRRDGPFVAINCAAIPPPLIEAELFGYSEGAFTGARQQGAPGKLREANGGTLFLDEIGDMPLSLQSVLLRVLETRSVTPLGGGREYPLDIAIICASHHPLQEKVGSGHFRADLFFRLNGITLWLPPLRQRSDLPSLARRILAEEADNQPPSISSDAMDLLRRHDWPGNIRQLRNVLRLAAALIDDQDPCLRPHHLPAEMTDPAPLPQAQNDVSLRSCEIRLVREAVARCGGNISAAARELGITRTTLYRKLQQEG
ncbi:sigma-54-dependent Fis family transcriptional regulator [Denitratisoma sp. agr-D3]